MQYFYFALALIPMIIMLIISCAMLFISLFSVIANFKGAPYVPTSQKEIDAILNHIKVTKNQHIIELGSGDGRFIRSIVKKYGVKGLGVDIQPWLIWYSRILAHFQGLKNAQFKNQNFYKTDLSQADIIFLFLMPNTLKKLTEKFKKECKKDTLFISHGFKIHEWEKYKFDTIEHKPFPTYFYRLHK